MLRYRSEIDGLRAIAVLGVFFFHLDKTALPGGWLGVDIFFVISGYLISSLLLNELNTAGTISLSRFYQRRVRRILPALIFCLLGSFCIALSFSRTDLFEEYSQSVAATLFSVSNIFFWLHSGYFALDSAFVPLLHTWTLGVEEQFYLVVPALFVFLGSIAPQRRKLVWLGFLFVAIGSFAACRYGTSLMSFEFRYYMLPTRFWELSVGTFVATILHYYPGARRASSLHDAFAMSCLIFLGIALSTYNGNSYFAEKALFVTVATAVFLVTANENGITGRLLRLRPLRFVGQISYSLYLWHWPLVVLWNVEALRWNLTANLFTHSLIVIVGTSVASLSWWLVETPFRKKATWGELKPLGYLTTAVLALSLFGAMYLGGGDGAYNVSKEGMIEDIPFSEAVQGRYIAFGPAAETPLFMLLGDSHARSVMPLISKLADEYDVAGRAGVKSSTSPIIGLCPKGLIGAPPFAKEWLRYAKEHKIKYIVMVAKWDGLYALDGWHHYGGSSKLTHAVAVEELRATVRSYLDLGCDVWVLDQVPRFSKNPIFATRLFGKPYAEPPAADGKSHFARHALDDMASSRLHILDAWPYLIDNGLLRSVQGMDFLYFDNHHLAQAGALKLRGLFEPLFMSIKAKHAEKPM